MLRRETTSKLINIGVSICAMVIIICISVTITVLARPLYYFDIEYLDIPAKSGISAEACKLNYDTLIDYNLLGGPEELVFPTLWMSETGRIHFEEVKDIFIDMQTISVFGVACLVFFAIYVKCKGVLNNSLASDSKDMFLWMKYTFPVTAIVAATVGFAMAIDWQWAFTTMHEIFFDNDYWIFNSYTDPVIKILPEEFFFHCGLLIVTLTIAQIAILRVVYGRLTK
ncbi:MAG: TIGR01906 family membrane protein [Firmicutes bacterium]|nr:TIGR01906 family membrane protein [Bacillota bacterium]